MSELDLLKFLETFAEEAELADFVAVLKELPSGSIDLIYIDPPFFSNREYKSCCNVAFSDKWAGGINHYIGWLYERVEVCKS